MGAKKDLNHNLSVIGWGALFIWWGIGVMIDPITLGMIAVGTGLIMLVINAIRALKDIDPISSTTTIGLAFLAWGILDQARLMLGLPSGLSFALALFVIGLSFWISAFTRRAVTE